VKEIMIDGTFESWQREARRALAQDLSPGEIYWSQNLDWQPRLFAVQTEVARAKANIRVPAEFIPLAKAVACHGDFSRWTFLYRALWRLSHGERNLLRIETDDTVAELRRMRKQVSREVHKMHAFVRFRKVTSQDGEVYVAWYEPRHHVVKLAAPFFVERFHTMCWSILTAEISAHWDGHDLRYSPGVPKSEAPLSDELESWWRTYYGSIFNPARTNLRAMKAELPVHFWKHLPELENLTGVLAEAPSRVDEMIRRQRQAPSALPFVPASRELPVLREAASRCLGCPIGECATQTVFGEGPSDARIMLVGEQPGDEEDRAGHPFVGPAGQVLNRALAEAGLSRGEIYLTNAVKHFKFVERGKRRIHQTPRASEVAACRPWLEAEVEAIRPDVLVCLGATSAKSVFGHQFRLTEQRGSILQSAFATKTVATFHPSAILRVETEEQKANYFRLLVQDLVLAKTASHMSSTERNALVHGDVSR
jgi:uracil-DNA glycosylase